MATEWSWWRALWTVAISLVMFAGLVVAGTLLLAGASILAADALVYRRWLWLSVPVTVAGCALLLRASSREVRARRRLIGAIKRRVLDCLSCGAPLPRWDGSFRRNPDAPEICQWVGRRPEGSFRLHCGRCLRDAWFDAHIDGSVNHTDWAQDRPKRTIVSLDDN
jgi:hypothetical protein